MKVLSKTTTSMVLILVALLFLCARSAGNSAFAQYDAPPESQYDLPSDGQYEPPPLTTGPLPEEDQYGAPPEGQNVGGGTTGVDEGTALINEGDDGANGDDDGANETTPPERSPPAPPPDGGRLAGLLDGALVDGLKLLAILSVVTTLLFFVERYGERRGL